MEQKPCLKSKSEFNFAKSVIDTSVTSSGIKESLEQLSPTATTVLSHPFKVPSKEPATIQLTLNSSSSDVMPISRCDGVMTSSSISAKLASGKAPTCKVCSDVSSGYHYGVDSCEGCKGFFRRCITQGITHKCSNDEKCEITPFTRNSCQYCRLKKCFAVGMSREASRLGRRPKRLKDCSSEQKRETVVPIAPYPSAPELYNLRMAELQKLVQNNGTFKSELMQAFLSAAQVSFKEHQRSNNSYDIQKSKKGTTSSSRNHDADSALGCFSPYSSDQVNSALESDKTPQNQNNYSIDSKVGIIKDTLENFRLDEGVTTTNDYNSTSTNKSEGNDGYSEVKLEPELNNGEFSMIDDFMPEAGSPFFGISELSPDTMIMMPDMMVMLEDSDMVSNMMMATNMPDMMNACLTAADDNCYQIDVDRIMEEVKQFPSSLRRKLIDQVIQTVGAAHLATVTPTRERVKSVDEKFQQKKLNATLPDISKVINPQNIWHKFVQNMVTEITKAIQFCKQLPGFSDIVQDDQIVLIKKGSFEILLCRMCLLVDHVNQEMFDPSMEMKSSRVMIKNMPMGSFIDEFFNVAAELNPLDLTDREIGIFSAVLIMCPEREGLGNVLAIEKLNRLYLQSLYNEMSNNHSDYESVFARLICLIPMFNKVNRRHSMALNNLKMQKAPEIYEFPELHKEIYDISDD